MATPPLPLRRNLLREPGYDYVQPGPYFVTICTHECCHLFGDVVDGGVKLSEFGQLVLEEWQQMPQVHSYVWLDAFVIMPNHLHGIVWIADGGMELHPREPAGESPIRPAGATVSLGTIIEQFKSGSTERINARRAAPGTPVWQQVYYDRIVRHEAALAAIRLYIRENPQRWHLDRYHPQPNGLDPRAREIWRLLQRYKQGMSPLITIALARKCDERAARSFCEAVQRCCDGVAPAFGDIAQEVVRAPAANPEEIAERFASNPRMQTPVRSERPEDRQPKRPKARRAKRPKGRRQRADRSAYYDDPEGVVLPPGWQSAPKNPLRSKNRLDPAKAKCCSHGIPFYRKCAICNKAEFDEWHDL